MQLTDTNEIKIVSQRLSLFEDDLDKSLVKALLKPTPRMKQHRLFYLLLDDRTYLPIKHAMEILNKYGDKSYINKALKRVQASGDPVQYNASIAEIITAAYYIDKFKYQKDKVIWERTIPNTKRSVDVTINGYTKPINIEVTGLTEMKEIRDFYSYHYEFRSELKKLVANKKYPKFMYMITLPDIGFVDIKSVGAFKSFIKKHTGSFADFIKSERKRGPGEYTFTAKDGSRAQVKIHPLNKLKNEYVELAFGWSGRINDSFRIRSKVLEKAEKQLPPDEYNFVYVANLAMLDEDDYIEAMYGQLQVIVNTLQPSKHRTQYADNGISQAIEEKKLSPVHGLIKSPFSYNDPKERKVILNNRFKVPRKVIELLS